MSHGRRGEIPSTVDALKAMQETSAKEKAAKERKELLAWTAADALQVASEVDLRRKAELDKAVDDLLFELLKDVKKQAEAGETKLTLAVGFTHKDAIIDRLTKKGFRYNATSNIVEWGEPKVIYRDGLDYKQHGLPVSKFRTKYSRRVGGVVIPS